MMFWFYEGTRHGKHYTGQSLDRQTLDKNNKPLTQDITKTRNYKSLCFRTFEGTITHSTQTNTRHDKS